LEDTLFKTPLAPFNVRIFTGDGQVIDVPCSSEREAREIRNAALNEGSRVRIRVSPVRLAIIRHPSVEDN
jgi:hypothetical protein